MDTGLSQGVNAGLGDTIALFIRHVQTGAIDPRLLRLIWQHLCRTQERGQRGSGGWRDGEKVSLRRRKREMDEGGYRKDGIFQLSA